MATVDVTITARGGQVDQPIIWRLAREFDVQENVTKANVDANYAIATLRLEGELEEVQRATAWLMTTGLHVEAEQRSVKE